jgi:hypothetical protein
MYNIKHAIQALCTPAYLYFVITTIALIISGVHNRVNNRVYSMGCLKWVVPSTLLIFIGKMIYIVFWTWLLHLMCKSGRSDIAWVLVILPIALVVSVVSLLFIAESKKTRARRSVVVKKTYM